MHELPYLIAVLFLMGVGVYLLVDATRYDDEDPWVHPFVGTDLWCSQLMDDDSLCDLTREQHEEVYGS